MNYNVGPEKNHVLIVSVTVMHTVQCMLLAAAAACMLATGCCMHAHAAMHACCRAACIAASACRPRASRGNTEFDSLLWLADRGRGGPGCWLVRECFDCSQHELTCEGPSRGACKAKKASSAPCVPIGRRL
jgi:hypothetical protein